MIKSRKWIKKYQHPIMELYQRLLDEFDKGPILTILDCSMSTLSFTEISLLKYEDKRILNFVKNRYLRMESFLTEKTWIYTEKSAIINVNPDDLKEIFKECPKTRHQIKMMGRMVDCPRFIRLYGAGSYKFSGTILEKESDEIPSLVMKCFNKIKQLYPQYNWNGALVNWYPDGDSYIGPHADDTRDLVKGSPICSFSFGASRIFRVKGQNFKRDFITENNSLIVMGGDFQKEFEHEIVKTAKIVKSRLNITIRAFR